MTTDILQYESTIWNTADLLRGSGIKESEWPSYMMPFFALSMIESRLLRMLDELIDEFGAEAWHNLPLKDRITPIEDKGQGYNKFIFEREQTLRDLVKDVYCQIRGQGKAMLAVSSIKAAILYKVKVTEHFNRVVQDTRYAKYAQAPIYIVYSNSQGEQKASTLNNGKTEATILKEFSNVKNGLIIVVAKLQTGYDEKKLHTLFLDKEISGISAIQTISRVNRTTKHKDDCKIVDFSYNNVNVNNIKKAFEHFSNVVVSNFDPFSDSRVLDIDYTELRKSQPYHQFFHAFASIFQDGEKRDDPNSYLEFESQLEKFIHDHSKAAVDAKAKAAQYFTILNRIEHVIILEDKYSEGSFLAFWRKYKTLYNQITGTLDERDPIEVYFDFEVGIIEPEPFTYSEPKRKETKVAEGQLPGDTPYQYPILEIIEALNENEETKAELIKEFEEKITSFFNYIHSMPEGERLILKIKSNEPEDEIYDDFGKIYRKYKIRNRTAIGEYFFEDNPNLLCDNFIDTILDVSIYRPDIDIKSK